MGVTVETTRGEGRVALIIAEPRKDFRVQQGVNGGLSSLKQVARSASAKLAAEDHLVDHLARKSGIVIN